ncbi:MAG: hypothetical protein Q8P20_03795 [bacterium]|nr:hypothetical protein [bacterium]
MILEGISYKKKLIGLLIVFFLLGIGTYKRSIALTIDAYRERKELKQKLNLIKNNSNTIERLESEIKFFNGLIGEDNFEPQIVQQEILNFVSNTSSSARIQNIDEIHSAIEKNYLIYTNFITLTGAFNDLLAIIYDFEKNFPVSKIVSIEFFQNKNFETKKTNLYAKIIFQNYKKEL